VNDVAANWPAPARALSRDYHAFNLIVDRKDRLRIIDHQMPAWPSEYDLVRSCLIGLRRCAAGEVRGAPAFPFAERERLGLAPYDPENLRCDSG